MAPPRRIDVVLDSVKRLLRIGATANLINLLQKQHPADLAQIFKSLLDNERQAVFSILVERNGRLAMETVSEMGPEQGAQLLTGRSAEEIAKLLQEIPSDDAAALIDYLPEELSARGARTDAAARVGTGRKPARVRRADRRPHHESQRLRVERRPDGRRIDHRAPELARRRDGVLPLRRRRAPPSRGRHVAAAAAAGVARDAAEADHDARRSSAFASTPTRKKSRGRSRRTTCWRCRSCDEENKLAGVITVDDVIDVIKDEATEDLYRLAGVSGRRAGRDAAVRGAPQAPAVARGQPGHGVRGRLGRRAVRGHDQPRDRARRVHADRRRHGRQCRDADAHGDRSRAGAGRIVVGQRAQGAGEGGDHRAG